MKFKVCTKCKYNQPIENFSFKNKSTGKRASECKNCHKIMKSNYYKNNKIKVRNKANKRRNELREWYNNLKSTLKCEKCGENHPATLQFHHVDKNNKDFYVSKCIERGFSKIRILKEMKKCIVLCANCHAKLHASITQLVES